MSLELDFDSNLQQRLEQEADRRELTPAECIRQLLAEHLPPRCESAIADYEHEGVRCQLARLSDPQFSALRRQCVPIEVDGMFQLMLLHPRRPSRPAPQLGELYTALRMLFGESGTLYDDYKGSFSFPLLLYVKRETGRFRYLLEVDDWKGGLEFHLWKVADRPEELGAGVERHVYRQPIPEEFSREELHYYLAHFYGLLQGFIEAYVRTMRCEPFVKAVPAKLALYGHLNGEFFEDRFDSEEEYQQAREALTERAANELKAGRVSIPDRTRRDSE